MSCKNKLSYGVRLGASAAPFIIFYYRAVGQLDQDAVHSTLAALCKMQLLVAPHQDEIAFIAISTASF
ncbi:hypothetical protein GWI33_007747 [Rhynchophorus ferrugineus]|uniref:Uncharacterized protein n=1 Tax=Rhynchophorus ferrugineus TaxID=354439 RepID=A0A834IT85_RHYFE|nr:hypothetical protein GWI33_007747 [Rhynchophorus ferrugineus]